jgi:hypothetical protein
MIFEKGYTFKKIKTSHGSDIYISRFGQIVKVVPCCPQMNSSDAYVSNLIHQIEYID